MKFSFKLPKVLNTRNFKISLDDAAVTKHKSFSDFVIVVNELKMRRD